MNIIKKEKRKSERKEYVLKISFLILISFFLIFCNNNNKEEKEFVDNKKKIENDNKFTGIKNDIQKLLKKYEHSKFWDIQFFRSESDYRLLEYGVNGDMDNYDNFIEDSISKKTIYSIDIQNALLKEKNVTVIIIDKISDIGKKGDKYYLYINSGFETILESNQTTVNEILRIRNNNENPYYFFVTRIDSVKQSEFITNIYVDAQVSVECEDGYVDVDEHIDHKNYDVKIFGKCEQVLFLCDNNCENIGNYLFLNEDESCDCNKNIARIKLWLCKTTKRIFLN